jgi:hypothetical protein
MKYGNQPNGIWVAWHFPDISPVTRKVFTLLAPIITEPQTEESLKTFLLSSGFTRSGTRYVDDDLLIELYTFKATGQPSLSIKLNHTGDAQTWIANTIRRDTFMHEVHGFAKHAPLACY